MMSLDFDVGNFLYNLKATKPPYECPVHGCGKIYKSFSGIQSHLENFDHNVIQCGVTPKSARKKGKNKKSGDASRSPSPVEIPRVPREPRISYIDASKCLEYECDGLSVKFHINDQLPVVSKEHYEASVPVSPESDMERSDNATGPAAAAAGVNKQLSTAVNCSTDDKKHKLPAANFIVEEDYDLPDAPPMPNNYIRFIEKSNEVLDEETEYDMDEEDCAWLEIINERRKAASLPAISAAHLELLIDRLEKESFFQAQTTMGTNVLPTDEEAVCCICMDGECENSNVILFCDMCNMAVHQECYGVPYIPEGQWWCRRCLQSPSRAVDCVLCPNKGGAFKQTDDSRWAHVVCALWVPEVCFANTVFLEPIDSIDRIPAARWKLSCYICKQRNVGACIQCHKANCYTAFHVTCAQQAGVHMRIDAVRETSSTGTFITVRKAAYCDIHTPSETDPRPNVEESLVLDSARKAQAKAESRQKMRKARKILAERRSAVPVVSVPTIPPERIQHLASLINYPGKNSFIQRLLAFWTLKRYSRNGVPLLRRLQASNKQSSRRSLDTSGKTSPACAAADPASTTSSAASAGPAGVHSATSGHTVDPDTQGELRRQLQCWHRLRQDLEKVRLLCELVRKREKTKRELVKCLQCETRLRVSPLHHFLEAVVDQLCDKDQGDIFADPVDTDEVSDYMSVISEPMDLSTIRNRVRSRHYGSLSQMIADFDLMVNNCLSYNDKHTMFYKAGVRMRQLGGIILRRARRDMELIGLKDSSGLLSPADRCKTAHHDNHLVATASSDLATLGGDSRAPTEWPPATKSDEQILEEVDCFLNGEKRSAMSDDQLMNELLEHLTAVECLKHGGSRVKWTRTLKSEISKIRRRKALALTGSTPGRKPSKLKQATREETAKNEGIDHSSANSKNPVGGTCEENRVDCDDVRTRTSQRNKTAGCTASVHGDDDGDGGSDVSSDDAERPPSVLVPESTDAVSTSSAVRPVSAGTATPAALSSFAATAGVNRRTAVLFNKKAAAARNSPSPQKRPVRKRQRSSASSTSIQQSATQISCSDSEDLSVRSSQPTSALAEVNETASSETERAAPVTDVSLTTSLPLSTTARTISPHGAAGCCGETAPNSSVSVGDSGSSYMQYRHVRDAAGSSSDGDGGDDDRDEGILRRGAASKSLSRAGGGRKRRPPGIDSDESDGMSCDDDDDAVDDDSDDDDDDNFDDSGDDTVDDSADVEMTGVTSRSRRSARLYHSCSGGILDIELESLDLIWAKCRGYPWYPALIIDPKMPRTGYFHNGVPIPVPPSDVLSLADLHSHPMFLVLFFDAKRTWQWLPRDKLEPLGVEPLLDQAKLVSSRKPSDRRAVRVAFEKAVQHQCRVTGKTAAALGLQLPDSGGKMG